MPGVIYRQDDGLIVFPVAPDQPFRGLDIEVDRNVVPNYGGHLDDFAWLDLDAEGFRQLTETANPRVVDGQISGTNSPPPVNPTPPKPTVEELLAQILAMQEWAAQVQAQVDAATEILMGGLQ